MSWLSSRLSMTAVTSGRSSASSASIRRANASAPLIGSALVKYLPQLAPVGAVVTFTRLAVAAAVLVVSLIVVHLWLPAGRRRLAEIAPGGIATLVLWLLAGTLFGRYLADFAFTYSRYYAGLASPMIVVVFLYFTASIFIYGGELNSVLRQRREDRRGD